MSQSKKCIIVILVLFFALSAVQAQAIAGIGELHIRQGLPNFAAKIKQGKKLKVAYFGGSITQQDGWRVYSMQWLQKRYPKASFEEVNAAIGGTGSEFGAFRLQDHVLQFKPDLMFVEFAVNDYGGDSLATICGMEGIVRHAWKDNPSMDICFIYTLQEEMRVQETSGTLPASAAAMEKVADRYAIPSINFGVEICKRVQSKTLVMTNPDSTIFHGTTVFSRDGVHPYEETGHRIYQQVFARSFRAITAGVKAGPAAHTMGSPLQAGNYSLAAMIDVEKVNLSANWSILPIDPNGPYESFRKFLPRLATAERTGETISLRFKGTRIGVYDVMGPATGRVIVEVDGVVKDTMYRFDAYCTWSRMNTFVISLPDAIHNVVFRVLAEPFDKAAILKKRGGVIENPVDYEHNNWYVGKILIDGELLN
ncbi:MAG: SGNH/GDSL hydrolase family protein [Flavitalea sp.]